MFFDQNKDKDNYKIAKMFSLSSPWNLRRKGQTLKKAKTCLVGTKTAKGNPKKHGKEDQGSIYWGQL